MSVLLAAKHLRQTSVASFVTRFQQLVRYDMEPRSCAGRSHETAFMC